MLKIFGIVGLGVIALAMPVVLTGCSEKCPGFSPDVVLVTLTRNASTLERDFTQQDFPGVKVESVYDLTGEMWHAFIRAINNESLPSDPLINTNTFRRILSIRLAEPSHQNVIDAIAILNNRPNIENAGKNYYVSFSRRSI